MTEQAAKRRTSEVTVLDMFCGAGGSSLGARDLGMNVRLAMNHWQTAITTHNRNFPDTDHVCADISATDPRRYQSTDILIASPECTNMTSAKGVPRQSNQGDLYAVPVVDTSAERSRATMWDVPRFAECHKYAMIVCENVVDARHWVLFDAWLMAMHALGYDHRAVFLNSMHAGAVPQSRDRMYVVFWRKGNKAPNLDISPAAHCGSCGVTVHAVQAWKRTERGYGKYRAQYVYRCPTCAKTVEPFTHAAASAIDWSIPSVRIGDRVQPLAEKTIARIRAGIDKFWPATIIQAAGHTYESGNYKRAWSAEAPLPTQMGSMLHGVAMDPLLVDLERPGNGASGRLRTTAGPFGTQTARHSTGVTCPPFIAELRGGGSEARSTDDPLATVCASGNHHGLVIANYSPGWVRNANTDTLGSITTVDHHALLEPPAFLSPYYGNSTPSSVTQPVPTVTGTERCGLVERGPSIDVDDCYFRMLDVPEIGRAMAFPDDYVVTGNKRGRVRQYGNAVTPPAMSLLLERCMATLR